MRPDRQALAIKVLEGKADPDLLTWEEIIEIEERVHELIFKKHLELAVMEGKIVFSGFETERIH